MILLFLEKRAQKLIVSCKIFIKLKMQEEIYHVRLIVSSWDKETIEANYNKIKEELHTKDKQKADQLAFKCLNRIVRGYYDNGGSVIELGDKKTEYDDAVKDEDFWDAYFVVESVCDFSVNDSHCGIDYKLTYETLDL